MNDPTTATAANAEDKQDLHISEAHKPDANWARMQPIQIQASPERIAAAHQLVSIRNTHRMQKHVVIDRHMVGHELEPGQEKKDIDMLVSEIEYFLRQRAPNRFDALGRKLPPIPIEIVGFKPIEIRAEPEHKRKAAAA
jgi:hypothetical protein